MQILLPPLFRTTKRIQDLIPVAFLFSSLMHFLLSQRAKVGPGKPADSSSSSSSVCKYDSNGNQDRVKLSDFNFIMVLGKGSFGKV